MTERLGTANAACAYGCFVQVRVPSMGPRKSDACSAERDWEACSSTTIHAQHEYFCHRATSQVVPKVGDGSFNPPVTPITIVLSHADGEVLDIISSPRPSGSALGTAIILLCIEFPVPGQQCVRRNKPAMSFSIAGRQVWLSLPDGDVDHR
jgi:hypothetical protein